VVFGFFILIFNQMALCGSFADAKSDPEVIQTPPASSIHESERVTFQCQLKGAQMNDYYMFWYRQRLSEAPEFISREGRQYGEGFRERFTAELQSSNNRFSLLIDSARLEDSAIYYCA
ncbi:LV657 protein, partial [Atractosteus spatula]|nr:LV657 protein [Atractosteus spatula]